VYGAGGAVGGAVARAFAAEGARLFLAGRTLESVESVAREVRAAGGAAEAARVDAWDERAVEEHFADVAARAGGVDVLFNAIGMQDVQGRHLTEMSTEELTRPILTAATTQFHTARAAARHMAARGSGVIMTITAGPSRRAAPNVGGFDAACAMLEALWRTFAAELGPRGVRTVVVGSAGSPDAPDVRETIRLHARAAGKSIEQVEAEFGSETLLRRLPGVAEVARAATIMASDYASADGGDRQRHRRLRGGLSRNPPAPEGAPGTAVRKAVPCRIPNFMEEQR
jgi:NAD(P)-dependent dehydrogenase (short-subunit alcohol dehydrogenase family)